MTNIPQPARFYGPVKPEKAAKSSWARALFLALLVIAVDVWTTHHLGWGLENPFGIAGLSAGVGFFYAFLEKLVSNADDLKFKLSAMPIWIVALLYLVCGIFAITRSSVLVVNEPGRGLLKPHLYRAGSNDEILSKSSAEAGLIRFVVPTSPFGRSYRLSVPGFRQQTLQVFPLWGVTISPERDLKLSPSILFRPPKSALSELEPKSNGLFWVLLRDGKSWRTIAADRCHPSSFLVGQEQTVPAEWPEMWKLETESLGLGDIDKDSASMRLQWKRFTPLTPGEELQPDMMLEARVVTQSGTIVARARTTLRGENLADISMTEESIRNTDKMPEVPLCHSQ